MTKKVVSLFAFASFAFTIFGERSLKTGIDAFNASIPNDSMNDVAFSPLSFELDCCVLAEALEPIARANVSEKLSVMTDFSGAYNPILDSFENAEPSNRVVFLSARTIGVSETSKVNADFKRRVFEMRCNASISLLWPAIGAERWIKAKLDGLMEEFMMPVTKVDASAYSFVDASAIEAELPHGVSCTHEQGNFRLPSGVIEKRPFCKFIEKVDFYRNGEYTTMRLPLRGGAFLYLMVPGEGKTLADVRAKITGETIQSLILEPLDPSLKGNGSSICEISIPRLDLMTEMNIEPGFGIVGIPEADIQYLYSTLTHRYSYQCVRFCLNCDTAATAAKKTAAAAERKAVFNRPFVYFIYIPDSNTIPVFGQFTGQK